MNDMINKIASGSKGNAIIYHKEIMIDVGVAYKHVAPYLDKIKYILLTHKHSDHFKPNIIKRIKKEHPDITFIGAEWFKDVVDIVIQPNEWLILGEYKIASVELEHDVENVGYRIFKLNDDFSTHKILHCTDCYSLYGVIAENYDVYAIEFNHCTTMITEAIQTKTENGEYAYEAYSKSNHNSNGRAIDWLADNNVNGLVVPLHLSSNVNSVDIVNELIKERGWIVYD